MTTKHPSGFVASNGLALDLSDPAAFVAVNTVKNHAPLVPEIALFLADESVPIWSLSDDEMADAGLPPPFWAFAWAGGQALARYVLDYPEVVAGKRVLDFATGCGISAIAAMQAGATSVLASDIDPFATACTELNAELNNVAISTTTDNLTGCTDLEIDVILAGDVCYEQPLSSEVHHWLTGIAQQGAKVFIGDPGRTYLYRDDLTARATYNVETTRELEDNDVRRTTVWQLTAD